MACVDYLLKCCCDIFYGDLLLGILLFTLITKIVLLPLSLWCQYNSLLMLSLMPEINDIKIIYWGDNDMITEAERKLFKQKRYNPFLSFVPLVIQLLLLLALLSAINHVLMEGSRGFVGMTPIREGGVSWIMPLLASASAAIFGWTQNVCNPLQREQRRLQQLTTNLLSVSISLLLGLIVPTGLAFYWMASNIFSIPIQVICNWILKPERYVNYRKLRKSQKKLQKLVALKKKKNSPELCKREKNDYKRFFSITNKHLVFYSESSGFYKYFGEIIDYLMQCSNVIVHYVTSDPNDAVFKLAEHNHRLKAYYIGDSNLITLFMKMDADIVVMTTPDLGRFHLKRSLIKKDIEYIYVDHAISSTHMTYREHAFDNFDTFFCVCQNQVDELRCMEKLYNTKAKNLVHFGYPLLDTLLRNYALREQKDKNTVKNLLIAPSWHEGNIFDGAYQQILTELSGHGFSITLRAHPEYIKRYPDRWQAVRIFCQKHKFQDVLIEQDFSSNTTIFSSDLVITDWSGIAYEFAFSVLKPVLFIETPMKVINPNYKRLNMEPINITMRSSVGVCLGTEHLDTVLKTVQDLLGAGDRYEKQILLAREKFVFNTGHSGAAGGKYILNSLINKQNFRQSMGIK